MTNILTTLEEFDIMRKLQLPHTLGKGIFLQQKSVAQHILARSSSEILFITPSGFNIDFIFAGLTENHIEHIAKNAPNEYKKEIMDLFSSQANIADIFTIAKAMDEDLGENVTQNQQRVKNVIQYIKDNRIAFEF